jgi:hypothetical protein
MIATSIFLISLKYAYAVPLEERLAREQGRKADTTGFIN